MLKKRLPAIVLCLIMVCSMIPVHAAEDGGRLINLVYDDSGSMVYQNGAYQSKWSQSKYGLELFAAMMGPGDVLNIYPMSMKGKIHTTVYGNDEKRAEIVRNMETEYAASNYSAVTSAAQALMNDTSGLEHWLVVMADSQFEGMTPKKVQSNIRALAASGSMKVAFMALGANTATVENEPSTGVYSFRASKWDEIPSVFTEIGKMIFGCMDITEYSSLSASGLSMNTDIPASSLIIIAEGKDIKAGSAEKSGRPLSLTEVMEVRYSDIIPERYDFSASRVAATNDKGLFGNVIVCRGDNLTAGDYFFGMTGAEKVKVFCRPHLSLGITLTAGDKQPEPDEIYSGDWNADVYFTCPITGKKVESDLLKGAAFAMTVRKDEKTAYPTLPALSLVPGAQRIGLYAALPSGITFSRMIEMTVTEMPREIAFEAVLPGETYRAEALEEAAPIVLKVTDRETGEVLTGSSWKNLACAVECEGGVSWNVLKTAEEGVLHLIPSRTAPIADLPEGLRLIITASYKVDTLVADGGMELTVPVTPYDPDRLIISLELPEGGYTQQGLPNEKPAIVKVSERDDAGNIAPVSAEKWEGMTLTAAAGADIEWNITKNSAGYFELSPGWKGGKMLATSSGKIDLNLSAAYELGDLFASGISSFTVDIAPYIPSELAVELKMPEGGYSVRGLDKAEAMTVTVYELVSGEKRPLSAAYAENAGIELKSPEGTKIVWNAVKTQTPGEWTVTPSWFEGDMLKTASGDLSLDIIASFTAGELSGSGTGSFIVKVASLSVFDKLLTFAGRNWLPILLGLLLAAVLIGYIPGIKNRLKAEAFSPKISFTEGNVLDKAPEISAGKLTIDKPISFLPYRSHTGVLHIPPVAGKVSPLNIRVKAAGKGNFRITNLPELERKRVRINGAIINGMHYTQSFPMSTKLNLCWEDGYNAVYRFTDK